MSRTYRRTDAASRKDFEWILRSWEWIDLPDGSRYQAKVWKDPNSPEMLKDLAKYRSDAGHLWMNYRGPSWFHREYSQVPYRARARQAIIRFFKNPDDEPIIESKPSREYWL